MTATTRRASRLPVVPLRLSGRAVLAGVALGAVAAVAALAATDPGPARPDPTAPARDRSALLAYAAAVGELNDHGGTVVVHGMRPGLADIAGGRLPDDALERMAAGWASDFRQLRAELRVLARPPSAAEAATHLDAAYTLYLRTAETLLRAARAAGPDRQALVEEAAALGRRADTAFDHGIAELERQQTLAGIDPEEMRK